nr:histidine kinase 3 [Tanacetum cinerariifolium]
MTSTDKDEYNLGELEPSPIQQEYPPVIFAQDTIAYVISLNMLTGKEDCENVMRARELGKGVLTSPFELIKTNHLGVILTFDVYKRDLPFLKAGMNLLPRLKALAAGMNLLSHDRLPDKWNLFDEPGALMNLFVNATFVSEDDEETRVCKTLFQNKTFFIGHEVPRE